MTAATAPDRAWVALLRRPALRLAAERLDVVDLVLLGLLDGRWAAFEADLRRRLRLEAVARDRVTVAQVRARATAFRYARGLVSAADFTAWLSERSLTLDDLSGTLARELLDDLELADVTAGPPAGARSVADVLRVEALSRGILDALAATAVRGLAAAQRTGGLETVAADDVRVQAGLASARASVAAPPDVFDEAAVAERLCRLAALEDAVARVREEVAASPAIDRRLAERGLDWLRLDGEQLSLTREGAAREARLLLTLDGVAMAEVGARAGTSAQARTVYVEDAPRELAGAFAAAAPGEVIGPWRTDDAWHVLLLTQKTPPRADDAELRARATDEVLDDVLAREAAGRTERLCVL